VFGDVLVLYRRSVVLPWSAAPLRGRLKPRATTLDLLSPVFLFGIPIALAARAASPVRQTNP
jgi:hypothetical protein